MSMVPEAPDLASKLPSLSGVILLADPDETSRQQYAEYLRRCPIQIDEATDGREALARAISRRPDLVVADDRLPGIDGFTLCGLLRRDPLTSATPIIVLSGDGSPSALEKAERSGVSTLLVKPCPPDVLFDHVHRAIRRTFEDAQQLRHSSSLREAAKKQFARTAELHDSIEERRPKLSRRFRRYNTDTPPIAPPKVVCPTCNAELVYEHSYIGGVSERMSEQWDHYHCRSGCGTFKYRQRTRKLTRMVE